MLHVRKRKFLCFNIFVFVVTSDIVVIAQCGFCNLCVILK